MLLPVRRRGVHEAVELVARVYIRDQAGRQLGHDRRQRRLGDEATADCLVVQTAQHAVLAVPILRHRARASQESGDVIGADVLDIDLWPHLPTKRFQYTLGTCKVLAYGLSQGPVLSDQVLQFHSNSPKSK